MSTRNNFKKGFVKFRDLYDFVRRYVNSRVEAQYKGAWNASTNTPTLADGIGDNGDFYRVSVAGTQNLGSGSIAFTLGDEVRYNEALGIWQKFDTGVDYVPENVANKENTTLDTSTTKYPTINLLKTKLDLKQDTLTSANFGSFSNSLTGKTTPVDADSVNIVDSEASNVSKKLSWANLKATLKTYLDTLYLSLTGGTLTGDLSFSGNGRRITGDFSNSTRQNRLSFKTSTTNGNTLVQAIPDGSAVISGFIAYGGSDANNSPYLQVHAENSSHVGLNSSKSGSGTTQNLVFQIDGVTKAYIDAVSGSFSMVNSVSTGGANTVKEYSANSGSAITIDPANGEAQYITLTAATPVITFASAPAAGTSKRIKLTLIQDGTGGRLPTFANCTFLSTGSSTATAINSEIGSLTYFEAEAINGAWVVASADQNLGVIDGSVAAAGYIGEVISSSVAIGSAVTGFATATAKDVTSLSLTKGNWEVSGNIHVIAAGGAAPTKITCSISDTSNTQATSPNGGAFAQFELSFTANGTNVITLAPKKFYLSSSSTKYLVLTVTFASGSVSAAGSISAERFM